MLQLRMRMPPAAVLPPRSGAWRVKETGCGHVRRDVGASAPARRAPPLPDLIVHLSASHACTSSSKPLRHLNMALSPSAPAPRIAAVPVIPAARNVLLSSASPAAVRCVISCANIALDVRPPSPAFGSGVLVAGIATEPRDLWSTRERRRGCIGQAHSQRPGRR
jgi:hypothetical protein